MDLVVRKEADGLTYLHAGTMTMRCAIGRGGIRREKNEGDGGTPVGTFPLRRVFYRPDRVAKPQTRLPVQAMQPDDGWVEVPNDPMYNRLVKLPYPAAHETMWRDDHLYDVVVEIGYNDDPVVPGKGSAIFMHLVRDDYAPSAGCVTVRFDDMRKVLALCGPETKITIEA